jgi:hypothetical protein
MRHPGAEQIAFVVQKNLGFVDQPAKRCGVDDAVAVTLESGSGERGGFGKPPAA